MPEQKNQHYTFAYKVMPILFHSQTTEFMSYLEKDGIAFLQFWWDRVGEDLDESNLVSSEGLDYTIRNYENSKSIVLITMPPPHAVREAYFIALVSRPKRRHFFPWKNFARVISLERHKGEAAACMPRNEDTLLREWTPRGNNVVIGKGPAATLDDFYRVVFELVAKG